jgi:hypothetical protein
LSHHDRHLVALRQISLELVALRQISFELVALRQICRALVGGPGARVHRSLERQGSSPKVIGDDTADAA